MFIHISNSTSFCHSTADNKIKLPDIWSVFGDGNGNKASTKALDTSLNNWTPNKGNLSLMIATIRK